MSRLISGLILIALLAGCQNQTTTPLPTPAPLKVDVTPALGWLKPMMAKCAAEFPMLSLTVSSNPQTDQSLEVADILFQWSKTASVQGYTLKLGEDHLVVIIHPENPLKEMDEAQLAAIYSGTLSNWSDLSDSFNGDIQPWVYPSGDDSQTLFDSQVLSYDEIMQTALIAPDPASMSAAIGKDPSAIGIIPSRWLDSSVKLIQIIGYANTYLTAPILAITGEGPGGLSRDWLLCVQDKIRP